MDTYTLKFTLGHNRSQTPPNFRTCTLWVDGKKEGVYHGEGCDMKSNALAPWLCERFGSRLLETNSRFIRLEKRGNRRVPVIDGMIGMATLREIVMHMGGTLNYVSQGPSFEIYRLTL